MRTIPIVVLAMLGLAIIPAMPYGYYGVMRWVICIAAVYTAIQARRMNQGGWTWIWILIAGLYNPIVPVHASRGIWTIVNIGTIAAVAIFLSQASKAARNRSH